MTAHDRDNIHDRTVKGFGAEWRAFDQSAVSEAELEAIFEQYFGVFPWESLSDDAVGFDLGCGSGRWARFVAPRVGRLHCIDASADALAVARRNLEEHDNCEFHHASVGALPLTEGSMDFGYSLGVLHHVPDTAAGIAACAALLRPGAPLLLYLYYAFDNKPRWYRAVWRLSDALRRAISRLPLAARVTVTTLIAAFVYWPLARAARLVERSGRKVESIPLSLYRRLSFYTMRTDALDRFGTPLETRFSRAEIREMMTDAGLKRIRFSESPPYWCAVGFKSG
ncbi:MAG: class I SAM-dependent methyltransferase [Actinomycetota bacterium]